MAVSSFKDYDELQAAVGRLIKRPNLVTEIADWIFLTEIEYQRDCGLPAVEKKTTGTFSIGVEFEALPTDWLYARHWRIDSDPIDELKLVSMAQLAIIKQNKLGGPQPTHYALRGENIELAPVPTAATAYTLYYQAGMTHLSDDDTTNWLLDNAPDGLLYGAAMHSAP